MQIVLVFLTQALKSQLPSRKWKIICDAQGTEKDILITQANSPHRNNGPFSQTLNCHSKEETGVINNIKGLVPLLYGLLEISLKCIYLFIEINNTERFLSISLH